MIEQQGRVAHTNGTEAAVRIGGSSGCPACDAGKGCGAGVFAQLLGRKPVLVPVHNAIEARAGQVVTLGIPESAFLQILLRLYLLPLLSGLAGAAIGHQFANEMQTTAGMADGLTLIGGVIVFALALYLGRATKGELPRHLNIQLLRAVQMPPIEPDFQPKYPSAEF